ncbi:MAG TPA: hypothetical protein VFV23_05955 [Verrucomicrobiae bacterium]|nr:hypothetical protein [Verrucomicrobiae bacterium]
MKTTFRAVSACALAAGLFTVGLSSAKAGVIDNELADAVNVKLTMTYTGNNGKIKKMRVTSKDLVNAIANDWQENYSGDRIIYYYGNDDFWLVDKHNNLILDLTETEVLYTDYSDTSYWEKDGKNGSYTFRNVGIDWEFEFTSYGNENWDSSTLALYDYNLPYFESGFGTPIFNGRQFQSDSTKESFAGYGHNYDVSKDDYLPCVGTVTEIGSGILIGL